MKMKECPECGKRFNWWQRSTGENKEHVRNCRRPGKQKDEHTLAAVCRGCPAGCFEGAFEPEKNMDDFLQADQFRCFLPDNFTAG